MINNEDTTLIVGGNGPSLRDSNLNLIQSPYHVYRCNQFYFEDKYFLGKNIETVTFNPEVFFEQYYTLGKIRLKKEYHINKVYSSRMFWGSQRLYPPIGHFQKLYPEVTEIHEEFLKTKKSREILSYIKYEDLYHSRRVTSGVLLLFLGAVNGYKRIFLTGIDFYESQEYAFDHKKTQILQLMPNFQGNLRSNIHSKQVDLQFIEIIKDTFDLEIYSLSPTSPMNKIFPMPNHKNFIQIYEPEIKPEGFIGDILIPEIENPFNTFWSSNPKIIQTISSMNIYKRLVYDFLKIFKKLLFLFYKKET